MNKSYHTVFINGLKRDLPLFEVAPNVSIAVFNMLGDTEVVERAADGLAEKMPNEVEVLVTPEAKSIPLAHALAVRLKLPYVVARKTVKPYMGNALQAEVLSITTGKPQKLYIDEKDLVFLKNKRIALVDDVVSTGSTLKGLELLMKEAQAEVFARVAVFTEGDEEQWKEVISLGHLPVFKD